MKNAGIRHRSLILVALFAAIAFGVSLGVLSTIAISGPASPPGVGSGAIATDASHNIAFGTSTTQANIKLLVVGSTTDNSAYGLQVWDNVGDALFSVRNDGLVSISNLNASGTFTGVLTGTVSAGNVSSGQFGSNTGGGNYSFPGNVSANEFCNGSDCRTDVNRTLLCGWSSVNPCNPLPIDFERVYLMRLFDADTGVECSGSSDSVVQAANSILINFPSMCGYDWRIQVYYATPDYGELQYYSSSWHNTSGYPWYWDVYGY